jgi:hypothetical protein
MQLCLCGTENVYQVEKMYEDVEKMLKVATKPEVVIALCRYKIEIQFWRLEIGFLGRQSQWDIDRQEVLYSFA